MSNSHNQELGFDSRSLHTLASICPDPVISVNRDGLINHFNRAAANLLGYEVEAVTAKLNIVEFYGSHQTASAVKKMIHSDQWGSCGQIEGYETSLIAADGRIVPIRLSAAILREQGKEVGSVGFFHDMSSAKAMEAKLLQLSITDDLSGLYNRRHFNSSLIDETARSLRYNRPLSLICIDMDHFKHVNDRLGHQQGDRVINAIASALRCTLRSTDMAFRYGGDEFVALLPEAGLAEASALAERIGSSAKMRVTDSKDSSVAVDVTLSIGVAEFDGRENAQTLLKRADNAMYKAKRAGGNGISICDVYPASER